jgi:dephospho-CoA kinase
MLRVGLTGGIASGKSYVVARLAERGFHALDLDRIAHDVTAPGGPAYAELVAAFGTGVLAPDGRVDRRVLGARVFADERARERLNAIVHPRVREEEERRAAAFSAEAGAVVVSDAALLVEAGLHLRFDRLVVVYCRPEQQLERLMARDGLDRGAAQARIDAQLPAAEKRRFAHFTVDTSGSHDETDRQIGPLAEALEGLAREARTPRRVGLAQAWGALAHGPRRGPRGVTPALLLEGIAETSGLELAALARRLEPPAAGPWYRAARPGEGAPGPETLAAPLVIWSLARGAPDPEFVLAAAASLGRLTHTEGAPVASAVWLARALLEVAIEGRVPADLARRASGWQSASARWGGAPPAARLGVVFEAAAGHPSDAEQARAAGAGAGGDGELAGMLVGLSVGAPIEGAPPAVAEALRLLSG